MNNYTVKPTEVGKNWRYKTVDTSRSVRVDIAELISEKLAQLKVKHCLTLNEWGELEVYVPAHNYYDLITVVELKLSGMI